jgi:outer membrane protein OmpA-like peptidoglycan-associated protein
MAVRVNLATADALCTGAELLAPQAKGLADAKKILGEVQAKAAGGKGEAPIDSSMRARALCLRALTNARDVAVAGGGPSGDALLAELSGMGGYTPFRDERGVVATLSMSPAADAPFEGNTAKLTKKGKDALDALGRVAKAHPTFALVVVVHASGTPNAKRDEERGAAVKSELAASGADATKIAVQLAGTQLPGWDPNDVKQKAKNERVEVVFVGGGK